MAGTDTGECTVLLGGRLLFRKGTVRKDKRPVGLINASVGGSPAEAWISEEGLTDFPHYLNDRDICRSDEYVSDVQQLDRERRNLWNASFIDRTRD
jgi:sialate O-acetylesterase